MANDVKWIKLTTDMFEDEKIDFILGLPEGKSIALIWVRLLTMAGKCNAGGYIFLTENIPYTDEMLANRFKESVNVIKLAMETFQRLGMIESDSNGYIAINNWEKHQNINGLEKIREQNRNRVRKHRNIKLLETNPECNVTCNVTVTQSNATDIDKDIDKEKDINDSENRLPKQKIIDLYHSICKTFPKVRAVSGDRETHLRARWNDYKQDIEVFKELFTKAESSDFLTGRSGRNESHKNFKPDFDWLINPTNMAKTLEGKYNNKVTVYRQKEGDIL